MRNCRSAAPGWWVITSTLLLSLTGSMMYGSSPPYSDGPPPGYTGGFGEPTCHQCHADREAEDARLSIAVTGLPDAHVAGQAYDLTLMVAHPEMKAGGFQISARYDSGARQGDQAGHLAARGLARVQVDSAGVSYASHTEPAEGDSVTWNLRWTAPLLRAPVIFHVAANASNYDASEFGDRISTTVYVSAPHQSDAPDSGDANESSATSSSGKEAH